MFILFILAVSSSFADEPATKRTIDAKVFEGIKAQVNATDYEKVRIKEFPICMQSWTFHNFTFFETLDKVQELGVKYLQAYFGQMLSSDMPGVKFGADLSDDHVKLVKRKLMEHDIALVEIGGGCF